MLCKVEDGTNAPVKWIGGPSYSFPRRLFFSIVRTKSGKYASDDQLILFVFVWFLDACLSDADFSTVVDSWFTLFDNCAMVVDNFLMAVDDEDDIDSVALQFVFKVKFTVAPDFCLLTTLLFLRFLPLFFPK